jgi:hypothetical protein
LKKDGHKTVYTKQWASVDSVCPEHSFDKQDSSGSRPEVQGGIYLDIPRHVGL